MTITIFKSGGYWRWRVNSGSTVLAEHRTPYDDSSPRDAVSSYLQRAFPSAKVVEAS